VDLPYNAPMPSWCAVILEDDLDRIQPMRRILASLLPDAEVATFDAVPPFREFLQKRGHEIVFLSLDCDLTRPCSIVTPEDRGDGKDACEFLATCPPFCPVIVHSSNYSAVPFMLEKLRNASWHVVLVTPCSDPEYAWIEGEWKTEVERLMRDGWISCE
jgi:hypothetical protein